MSDISEMYKIRKTTSGKYEVYNPANDHVFGTHTSEKDARQQQQVLYLKAPPEKEKVSEMDDVHETAYDASVGDENFAYAPKGEPPSARKFKIGDAEHVKIAVSAFVNWSYRGNTPDIPSSAKPGIKARIAAAIHKHLSGEEAKYYSHWLSSGKKPDKKSVSEMLITSPFFTADQQARFPDVPTLPGVNITQLTKGDANPVFVTRPLAILDAVGKSGLRYDAAMLDFIQEQVATKRPAARRGHVSEMNRSSEFPPDEGYWIGVMRDSGEVFGKPTVFGKAYLVPGRPLHEMVPLRDAAGTPISNSIWGMAATADNGDGTHRCVALDLETIDFCPAERASLDDLGGKFVVTSEMEGATSVAEGDVVLEHDDKAEDLALIRAEIAKLAPERMAEFYGALHEMGHSKPCAEMFLRECSPQTAHEMLTAPQKRHIAEACMAETAPEELYKTLSDAHKQHIAEAYAAATGKKLVPHEEVIAETALAEMTGMKTKLAEMTAMQTQIAEMDAQLKQYRRQEFDRALDERVAGFFSDWHVLTEDGKAKIAALKTNLRVMVVAEMAGSTKPEDIQPAADKAWENFKPLAEITRGALSGPSAFVGAATSAGGGNGYDRNTGRYDEDKAKQAKQKLNL